LGITLAAEPVFRLGDLVVTNAMLTSALVALVLTSVAVTYRRVLSVDSPGRFQALIEWVLDFVLNLCEQTAGRRLGRRIFPLAATLFIFILSANWIGLLPGFGTIVIVNFEGHEVPLFRSANADLNMTVAMALISVGTVQALGILSHGIGGYIKELLTPVFMAPVQIVGEAAHVVSLAGRLFGNIFGGEVLLIVMYTVMPYVAPAVFLGLEVLFGFIQALIFTVLSIVYIAVAAGMENEEVVHTR